MQLTETQDADAIGCPFSGSFVEQGASLSMAAVRAQRYPFYRELRTARPVYFDPQLNMYLVTRYDDVQAVFRDPLTFSMKKGYEKTYASGHQEEFQAILKAEGGGFFRDGIMSDPPEHTRLRKLYEKAFTAHRVKGLEERIRTIIAGIIEGVAQKATHGRGQAEVVAEIAGPITAQVICEQLGLGDLPTETVQRWSFAVVAQLGFLQDREQIIANAKTMCELQNYLIAKIREREAEPREDLISDLVHARTEDDENPTLSFEEKVSSVRAMLIAGNETTASAIANMFYVLATEPETAAKMRVAVEDDRLISRFVEELLRRNPPVHGLTRMAARDVELGGVLIPEGSHMMVMFASANDDEKEFACPRAFDIERPNLGKQVGFGGGAHRCVGAALARSELKVVAQEIVRRLDDIRLEIDPDELTFVPSASNHMIQYLPISFTAR